MLSIFSCVPWTSVCLLWRNVCLDFLPNFLLIGFLVLNYLYIWEINPLSVFFFSIFFFSHSESLFHLVCSFLCCAKPFKFSLFIFLIFITLGGESNTILLCFVSEFFVSKFCQSILPLRVSYFLALHLSL